MRFFAILFLLAAVSRAASGASSFFPLVQDQALVYNILTYDKRIPGRDSVIHKFDQYVMVDSTRFTRRLQADNNAPKLDSCTMSSTAVICETGTFATVSVDLIGTKTSSLIKFYFVGADTFFVYEYEGSPRFNVFKNGSSRKRVGSFGALATL